MIEQINLVENKTFDPYKNLAMEEYLLLHCPENHCILYLWQNKNTVVIGRNQNPWKECRVSRLKESGGHLVRRLSGGGAVYHDLGNLNFTFLCRKENYSVPKQLDVIIEALKGLGINAEKSGRNDILAQGKKFSGNAFYKQADRCYHHGTIMLEVDVSRLNEYLNVPQDKLKAKGVDSVKSRVINLKELAPSLTIETLKTHMKKAFENVYGMKAVTLEEKDFSRETLEKLRARFSSDQWLYGKVSGLESRFSRRFPWGSAELCIKSEKNFIRDAVIYSDALNPDIILRISEQLKGLPYEKDAICSAIQDCAKNSELEERIADDIISCVKQEIF